MEGVIEVNLYEINRLEIFPEINNHAEIATNYKKK